jgi:hypothetical protein
LALQPWVGLDIVRGNKQYQKILRRIMHYKVFFGVMYYQTMPHFSWNML